MKKTPRQYFAYRSFWPELETMKKFRECGIKTFSFMVSNTANSLGLPYTKYPPVWKWNEVYDLDAFDRQVNDILEAVPDARLICMLDLNTPHWWTRYLGAFGVKYDSFYELGKISASQAWRQDVIEYMQVILKHAEEKYAGHIDAYILGCGGATEWHDRSRGEESIYRLMAYREWQQQHDIKPGNIPPRAERDSGAYDFAHSYVDPFSYYNGIDPTGCYGKLFPEGPGLMRTNEKNQAAIDYWRFCNEYNADTAAFFLKEARKLIRNEAELGMFFGYCVGHWTMVSSGHLAYERLLDSPDLDFIMAPIDYVGRGMGRGSTSMTIHETIYLKGKRMLQEMDQRTYTSNRSLAEHCTLTDPLQHKAEEVKWENPSDSREQTKKFSLASDGVWKNDAEIVAGMKRDTAFCMINRDSLWWFDMWGGFYKGKKVYETLAELKKLWDKYSELECDDASEILVVKDPENMYFLNDMDARCGTFHNKVLGAVSNCGMPYSVCSFNDMEIMNMERFKLIILCHPFSLSAMHQACLERIQNKQRHIIWLYGPGIIDAGRWNPANVEKICGTSFGAPEINTVERQDWTSIYVHDPLEITTEIIRSITEQAGCHAYCPALRPVCANSRLVSIHTALSEKLQINLPATCETVTELFSGRTWHNTGRVEISVKGPDSFLFLLDN